MQIWFVFLSVMVVWLVGCSTPSPSPSSTTPQDLPPEQTLLPDASTSPAVMSLLRRARQAAADGKMQTAESLLERTVRIEPRNATLWNYLAKLRLQQGRVEDAQGLAAKSTALAGENGRLVADNWRIIAHARYQGGDLAGAREAQRKARQIQQQAEH